MSPIDAAIIRRKLQRIAASLDGLRPIARLSLEEYRARFYERKATERLQQEAIEAALDVNAYLIAELGGETPFPSLRAPSWSIAGPLSIRSAATPRRPATPRPTRHRPPPSAPWRERRVRSTAAGPQATRLLLLGLGDPRVRHRNPVQLARALAELRDEVGPPGLRADQPGAALLGNLFVALGWVALTMLLCQRGWPPSPGGGRGTHGLTNYLLQTVICTTIFYGHGLGLFGRVDRAGQLAIVVGVWAFQLLASSAWLRYFAVGPVEWVTRWLVFGRRPSFWRSSPAAAEI